MRRVAIIVCTCLLLVGAAAGWGLYRADPAARQTGGDLYSHRAVLTALSRAAGKRPDVIFVGDSTLMGFPGFPSWPAIAQQRFLDPLHRRSVVASAPGIDFFAYWTLAGRLAALHPDVVVLVANLRVMSPAAEVRGFTDMIGEIDLADVPATLALPYAIRGLTAPRVLLARTLATPAGEDAFLRFEGARRDVHESAAWTWLGAPGPPPRPGDHATFLSLPKLDEAKFAAWDAPLGPDNPLLRFGAAAVRKLADAGIRVLVVVAPVPWERLAAANHFDAVRYAIKVDVLRTMVVKAGGELVDLHRALARDAFRDTGGHFTPAGAAQVAGLVAPRLLSAMATAPPDAE